MKYMTVGAIVLGLLAASASMASPFRYDFVGVVTSAVYDIEISEDQVAVGDTVTGFFAFPEFGSFEIDESETPLPWEAELSGLITAWNGTPSNGAAFILIDDGPGDVLSLLHGDTYFLGGLAVHLEDPTGTAFDGIPLGTLDLSDFSVARGSLEGSSGARIDFTLTRVVGSSPIPEPSAFLVFGAGLLAAARSRRRWRRRSD